MGGWGRDAGQDSLATRRGARSGTTINLYYTISIHESHVPLATRARPGIIAPCSSSSSEEGHRCRRRLSSSFLRRPWLGRPRAPPPHTAASSAAVPCASPPPRPAALAPGTPQTPRRGPPAPASRSWAFCLRPSASWSACPAPPPGPEKSPRIRRTPRPVRGTTSSPS
eukprot:scaffold888_cov569-Prasinococcus_capsulatus_cf.AAC.10